MLGNLYISHVPSNTHFEQGVRPVHQIHKHKMFHQDFGTFYVTKQWSEHGGRAPECRKRKAFALYRSVYLLCSLKLHLNSSLFWSTGLLPGLCSAVNTTHRKTFIDIQFNQRGFSRRFISCAAMFSHTNPVFTLNGEQTTLPLLNAQYRAVIWVQCEEWRFKFESRFSPFYTNSNDRFQKILWVQDCQLPPNSLVLKMFRSHSAAWKKYITI